MYTLSGIRAALNDLDEVWHSTGCKNAKDLWYRIFTPRQSVNIVDLPAPYHVPHALEKGVGIWWKYGANIRRMVFMILAACPRENRHAPVFEGKQWFPIR